jgi:tRNA(Arg) A34 adenosine deaminase TadA
MFKNQKDYSYLLKSLELAHASVRKGNHPFGALIVYKDLVIETSENDVVSTADVTGHAELNLIKKIQKKLSLNQMKDCTLYTSTEPCAMCSGAIYWAGITKIVYGCSTEQLNKIVGGSLNVTTDEVFKKGQVDYEIRDFSAYKIFQSIHSDFW